MKAEEKLARGRLSVLELAEALGNVSEACRRRGISRTQFYEYKRRFQTHGVEGLKDLPPVHKSHPMTTPEEVQEKIQNRLYLLVTRFCDLRAASCRSHRASRSGTSKKSAGLIILLGRRANGSLKAALLSFRPSYIAYLVDPPADTDKSFSVRDGRWRFGVSLPTALISSFSL